MGLHARAEEVVASPDRRGAWRRRDPLPADSRLVGSTLHLLHLLNKKLLLALTLLVPVASLVVLEVVLRLAWPGGAIPVFVRAPMGGGKYLMANPRLATRWFITETSPPNPRLEPFAAAKPANGFRVFAMGESSTAGFPYPRNVEFSRLLRDALRDVLPNDSVEVINLGIPATNSFALLDEAGDVIAQHPDAIVLYAGHNEFYGALGVGSTERMGGGALVTSLLELQRLRTVMLIRKAAVWLRKNVARAGGAAPDEASFMESLAANKSIELGSAEYRRGVQQFEHNLTSLLRRFRSAGIPVFVASLTLNLRDQPPLAAELSGRNGGADSVFAMATRQLGSGDTALAAANFRRARDLDVVRFRAPGEFNAVIKRVAAATAATYVPMDERFSELSPFGITGHELFVEHVHPNRHGYALMGQLFFEALRASPLLARASFDRLRPWSEYEAGQDVTPFDERVAYHTVRTLQTRWPFVPVTRQTDYRGTYVPKDLLDSLAFAVSRGSQWEYGKLQLADSYERRRLLDSAIAEYRGLVRDAPLFETPNRLLARALLKVGRLPEAESSLRRALTAQPTAEAAHSLAVLVLRRREYAEGIRLLQQSLQLDPSNADAIFQLAVALGASGDVQSATVVARRLAQVAPAHPGLPGLLKALGLQR